MTFSDLRRHTLPPLRRPIWRHTLLRSGLALAVAGSLAACGGDGGEGGGTRYLSLGTAPPGGAFFVVGGALTEVLNANPQSAPWEFTAEATKGSQENIRRIQTGELDLGLSNSAISYFAVRGTEGWDRAYDIRTVMTLAPNVALFVAPAGSGVRQLTDLKGKRVVVGVAGAGFDYFVRPLLTQHGVSYDDFSPLYNTQTGAVDMLADGSAAAAFLGGAVPTASITSAASTQDLVFIPYGEAEMEALKAQYPFFRDATIPAGTYRGIDEEFKGLNVGSMHLITSTAAPEDLIYDVTRSLYENRAAVVERHPAGRAINPEVSVMNTGTPFHPGAIRYFEEIGIWPADE